MKTPKRTTTQSHPEVPGYTLTELIYPGNRTHVYRGVHQQSQQPVVIKVMKRDYPTFEELAQFRSQFVITKNIEIPGIVRTLALEAFGNGYAIVMEDSGSISISQYLENQALSLLEIIEIAIELTTILHELHQQRIIHKDIKPANILIHPNSRQITLIDFSIASLLPKETQAIQSPQGLEGTLAYLAPEQTGRMNRGIDYRTDFYALGVTLYELLTGQLPFCSDDPLEIIYSHIAKNPTPVHEVNPEIPAMLGAIVAKLMAKNAEDRYQSALGLQHDLRECLSQWQARGEISEFALGQRDLGDRFNIPEKLYGRENEVQTLLATFDRVAQGSSELMLVAGFSGIGKTALVNEVHKPIARQRGYFIKGKFDQFQRNIPFSAFVQAFRDLMGQLLSESDAQIEQWKNQILSAVGENGQVLIDVIPELENILGKQPPPPELSGSAAQNRFNLLMQKFIQIFTSQEHPLVIFLDDLQWADSASLKLLQLLMQETGHLLVLGAYRDNEVSPLHSFILTVDEITKAGATVHTITLLPLSKVDINQLVADTLNNDVLKTQSLTELVYKKTLGNPFFATQFLKALYEEKQIIFNLDARCWCCDIEQVKALTFTDDVVEFMALQLQKLPKKTQDFLKLAACIGAQFDLQTLAIISESSLEETGTTLWIALQEGLIIPNTESYKFFMQSQRNETSEISANPTYRFLHDRVQQAAYSLIPEDQQQSTHLAIARLLRQSTPDAELEANIFEMVNHWNSAIALLLDPVEKINLAQLNLIAGSKAKAANAYELALKYCKIGLTLLDDLGGWQSQTSLMLALHEGAAAAAYLDGDFAQMEQWASAILAQKLEPLDRLKTYEIQIQAYTTQGIFQEAIGIAQTALTEFNTYLPEQPAPTDITSAVEKVTELLNGRTAEDLLDLPMMTEPEALAIMQLLSSVSGAAYLSASPVFPLIVLTQVMLSIQKGNNSLSAFSYSNYAVLLSKMLGDLDTAYDFAQMSSQLVAKLNARFIQPKVNLLLAVFFIHYKSHFRNSLALYKEGFQTAQEVGDVEFAGYNVHHLCQCAYIIGQDLNTLVTETEPYLNTLSKLNLTICLNYSHIVLQAVERLRNSQNQSILTNKTEQIHAAFTATNDLIGLHYYWVYSLTTSYLFNQYPQAIQDAIEVRQTLAVAGSGISELVFYFYDSLTALATHTEATDKTELLERVSKNQAILHHRAISAPMNFQHKYDLVEAEQHRVLGKNYEAGDSYDRAIAGAKANDYIQEEGLANELAAKFYLAWGKEKVAAGYMQEAYYCYARWGAKAKVVDLETRYPNLLRPILQPTVQFIDLLNTVNAVSSATASISIGTQHSSSSSSINQTLDLGSVLKASQVLSGTLQLDELFNQLTQIILQNSGGDRCVLIIPNDVGVWQVRVIATPDEVHLYADGIEQSHDLAIKLIQYVKNTQKVVAIDNLVTDLPVLDHYLHTQKPKSVLCLPILTQGRCIGILYLQNQLSAGVFNPERIAVLNFLCTQAAISLENARLYQQVQQSLTDLQQAQLKLVQSEKMSALGGLVSGVAHEINNPVGCILGNVGATEDYVKDLLRLLELYGKALPEPGDEIEAELDAVDLDYVREDLLQLIRAMRDSGDRIKTISQSLRTFSRKDTDHKQPFNLHDGIESTLLILRHRLKGNEHRPEIKVAKAYDWLNPVHCFPGQLNQVFMNIFANAIDVFDELAQQSSFAEIKAQKQQISIQIQQVENWVEIKIADNGAGIPQEIQAKIFDHLFTTKAVGKGTGLGLAIARQIVIETHGGKLQVNSQIGQGTEFVISLPQS
ncbi:trifunctional serine/threonine-protein kinase/ATP-binding protein/sensor histidine kinase [Oscillatoria acuminata]|uniref:histidine kinase n=1 Tax=Oscillatoria acuminata PCC 6304 TaxID=56110 RepID=K9THU8_9CYAN|nr:ATP-binding sensor histidine kinase [Oscillatoria acuminata]AFY81973.1 putative ATPase [Oscillatoria acuminata PCC 6304]